MGDFCTLKRGQILRGRKGESWKKEVLVCLDGGGIRGYASVLMLEKLMIKVYDVEVARYGEDADVPHDYLDMHPCHYVDYFYGTSTGGLIAIMFGRLRMSLREAKSAYTSLSSEIFDRKQHYRGLKGALPYMSPSWRTTGLEKSIKKIIADSVEPLASGDGRTEEQRLENIEENVVNSYVKSQSIPLRLLVGWEKPAVFRNFEVPVEAIAGIRTEQCIPFDEVPILSASRATTAAPGYFPPMSMSTPAHTDKQGNMITYNFIDGGAGTNNPTKRAFLEVLELRKAEGKSNPETADDKLYVVSIGTGIPKKKEKKDTRGKPDSYVDKIKNKIPTKIRRGITDTEEVHKQMQDWKATKLDDDRYFRFNLARGLHEMPMDKFKDGNPVSRGKPHGLKRLGTLNFMEHAVNAAFGEVEASELNTRETAMCAQLDKLGTTLAVLRHERMNEREMWQRLVLRTLYSCNVDKCDHKQEDATPLKYCHFNNLFTTAEEAKRHVCAAHPPEPSDHRDERMIDELVAVIGRLQENCAW